MGRVIQHPDIPTVTQVINSFVVEYQEEGWSVSQLTFDHFSSSYILTLAQGTNRPRAKIPTEVVDAVMGAGDPFQRRRLKKLIQKMVGVGSEPED